MSELLYHYCLLLSSSIIWQCNGKLYFQIKELHFKSQKYKRLPVPLVENCSHFWDVFVCEFAMHEQCSFECEGL